MPFILLFLLIRALFDYKSRAVLGFKVDFAYVFADNADGNQLDAAYKAHAYCAACPACHGMTGEIGAEHIYYQRKGEQ